MSDCVKRLARRDLQHGQASSGGAVRRLVMPGRSALELVTPGSGPQLVSGR